MEEEIKEILDSKLTIRLNEETHRHLIDLCLTWEISKSELVRQLIERTLEKHW